MATSSNQRSSNECRKRGWIPSIVEKFVVQIHHRFDCWGILDLVALSKDFNGIIGIQATDHHRYEEHLTMLKRHPHAKLFVEQGNTLLLWSWAKRGARGKRKMWELKEHDLKPSDFDEMGGSV